MSAPDLSRLVKPLVWTKLTAAWVAEGDVLNTVAIAADPAEYDADHAARILAALDVELLGALRFYSDEGHDGYGICITNYGMSTENGPVIDDAGERARAILAKLGVTP